MSKIEGINQGTISGHYVVKVTRKDGSCYFPFGEEKKKNMILDSFFGELLTGGNARSMQSFLFRARGSDSVTAPLRTDTGTEGTNLSTTYASEAYLRTVSDNTIVLTRDFRFDTETSEQTYSSCSIFTYENIAVSRFLFDEPITIDIGENLTVVYTLEINLPYLQTDYPVELLGDGLDFSGVIRLSSSFNGLVGNSSISDTLYAGSFNSGSYIAKNITVNTSTVTTATTSSSLYATVSSPFATHISSATKVSFYTTNHTPTVYPTTRSTTNSSTRREATSLSASAVTFGDNGSYIDITYYFAPTASSYTTGGVYFWYDPTTSASALAVPLKFNTAQTIPANKPVQFKIRWSFSRG